MRFDQSILDEIRQRIPLSEVVGRRVSWDRRKSQPRKGDFWACCPFHNEKSPSFHCDDRRGSYHCFGCGVSGDIFRFIQETTGQSFPDTVEELAREAGLALPQKSAEAAAIADHKTDLMTAMEAAAGFFEGQLQTADGARARGYIASRALQPATIKKFRIGYAPERSDALKRNLLAHGFTEETLIEAGLLIKPDDGRPSFDRFRDRVMIPIANERGRIVAFGGRVLNPDVVPKYLNSPETPIFHKGSIVFNYHRARQPAFEKKGVLVVEGYLDAIALDQAGIEYVVAPLGTAITEDQIEKIWSLADEPILCLDGDTAGIRAAERVVDRILPRLKPGKSFFFALLPDGQDPDDVVRAQGSSGITRLVSQSVSLSEFLWTREINGQMHDTPERKATLERKLYAAVSGIQDATVLKYFRDFIRIKLSGLFGFQKFAPSDDKGQRSKQITSAARALQLNNQAYRQLLSLCVEFPNLFRENVERIIHLPFENDVYRSFIESLHVLLVDKEDIDVSDIYKTLQPRYFALLRDIYGDQKEIVIQRSVAGPAPIDEKDRTPLIFIVRRGHRLLDLFPIMAYGPGLDFIERSMWHIIMVIEARHIEHELRAIAANASDTLDIEQAYALRRELEAHRTRMSEMEHLLDEDSQALKASGRVLRGYEAA